jgi:hypothetical protein
MRDDFQEFGVSGRVWGKTDVLEAAGRLPEVRVPLDGLSTKLLSSSVALLPYRSVTRSPDGGASRALLSSVWVGSEEEWRLVFHQGTPA